MLQESEGDWTDFSYGPVVGFHDDHDRKFLDHGLIILEIFFVTRVFTCLLICDQYYFHSSCG